MAVVDEELSDVLERKFCDHLLPGAAYCLSSSCRCAHVIHLLIILLVIIIRCIS